MRSYTVYIKKNIILWLLIYCVASLTVFQFIPIYFTHQTPRLVYYGLVYFALLFSSAIELAKYFKRTKHYLFTQILVPLFLLLGWAIALIFIIAKFTVVWVEAGTYYTSKANPGVRIVSRYLDAGALGGGTEPGDYELVLHRPITPYFKLETAVDTNAIDREDWVKH